MKSRIKLSRPIPGIVAAIVLLCAVFVPGLMAKSHRSLDTDWALYGGAEGDHYSSLSQINRRNVKKLSVAWKFDSGESGGLETNPIVVAGILYAYTPNEEVIAIDAATGKLLWKFDSGLHGMQPARAVSYWTDGRDSRIFAGILNYLYALDPDTGKPIPGFGENGRIDLRKNLRGDYLSQSITVTSPPTVYKNLIIIGGREPETHPAPPGDIRAFDAYTGELQWVFHTIPHPEEDGYETWPEEAWKTAGAANNWAGMTLDADLGIVYVPTGSAVFDFYGGDRVGNDLFADTLLALDAETGKRLWYFQGVHHDIWDRDFPSPPALFSFKRNGEWIDAIAQTTKQGFVYVFDRKTGQPLFPIQESHYPASEIPGEAASVTQPLPTAPEPFARQVLTEDMLTNRTPAAHAWAVTQFRTFRSGGQFVPFSLDRLTVVFPGFDGGAEWGGPAIDPATSVIFINSNEMAWLGGLIAPPQPAGAGAKIFQSQCSLCHGPNRAGSPPAFPSLVHLERQLTDQEIAQTIHSGKGRMPAFPGLSDEQTKALIEYLKTPDDQEKGKQLTEGEAAAPAATDAQSDDMPYRFTGYRKFLDPDGYPAILPPWGTLNAIDLKTGKYIWKIPLGEYPELAAKGMNNTGTENYGGPIVTGGGLVFIGASLFDRKFRAFDSSTGKLLWETELPYAGAATPATYMVNGKQYVVIASGGKDPKEPTGGAYVAFSLP